MAKASDHFKVVSVKDGIMTLEVKLSAPSALNRSTGTITTDTATGKEMKIKDGKNYVIGKAWGALPFRVNGKTPKINMSVMLPRRGKSKRCDSGNYARYSPGYSASGTD